MKAFLKKTNNGKKNQKSKITIYNKILTIKFKIFKFNKNKLLKTMNKISY